MNPNLPRFDPPPVPDTPLEKWLKGSNQAIQSGYRSIDQLFNLTDMEVTDSKKTKDKGERLKPEERPAPLGKLLDSWISNYKRKHGRK